MGSKKKKKQVPQPATQPQPLQEEIVSPQVEEAPSEPEVPVKKLADPSPELVQALEAIDNLEKSKETIDPEKCDPILKANIDGRKAANQVIQFIKDEFGDALATNKRFWTIIQEHSFKVAGFPLRPPTGALKALPEKHYRSFAREKVPYGKYEGRTVDYVLRHDPDHLKALQNDPDMFQRQLRRFLATKPPQKTK